MPGIKNFNRHGDDLRETLTEEERKVIDTPIERNIFSDAEIIQTFEDNGGDVAATAEEVGCSDATVYLRGKETPDMWEVKPRLLGGSFKYSPEQMIVAIVNARGNIQNAAVLLGCSRVTVKKYIAKFSQVRDVYLDQHDQVTDLAQSRLVEAIERGEPWALMFYYREYLPRYVLPVRGDSGKFPALLPIDESYDPDLNRFTDDQLAQLDQLASVLEENQASEG